MPTGGVTILISTRNRPEKLMRCLESIPRLPWIECAVGWDGLNSVLVPPEIRAAQHRTVSMGFVSHESTAHIGSTAMRNMLAQLYADDAIVWAVDDMEFQPGCLEMAMELFNVYFPDTDGVLGFSQEGNPGGNHHPTGVGMMGRKFLERYPYKHFLFPGYWLFACQEILWLAEKVGRFKAAKDCKIYHYHPASHKEEMDETHREGRILKMQDHKLITLRREGGMIWGDR